MGAIEVLEAEGWRGAARDAVKQTAELEGAQRQVQSDARCSVYAPAAKFRQALLMTPTTCTQLVCRQDILHDRMFSSLWSAAAVLLGLVSCATIGCVMPLLCR